MLLSVVGKAVVLGLLPGSGRSVGWVPTASDLNMQGLEQRWVPSQKFFSFYFRTGHIFPKIQVDTRSKN
jgi:hypothetical protein